MEVSVKGKAYSLQMEGTIGPLYKTAVMLGIKDTEVDIVNNRWHFLAYAHTLITLCNSDAPSMNDFVAELTTAKVKDLMAFIFNRWKELEGVGDEDGVNVASEGGENKKKD